MMNFETGDDLIALKESLHGTYTESERSPPSMEADEYARWNGLTVDSLVDPLADLYFDNAIAASLLPLDDGDLFEIDHLQECSFRSIIPASTQLEATMSSLRLLQDVCKQQKGPDVAQLMTKLCFEENAELKKLKLPVPILRSDHDADCRKLRKRLKTFLDPGLKDQCPPDDPTEPAGDTLLFSDEEKKGDTSLMAQIRQETMELRKEPLVLLSQSLKSELTKDEKDEFVASMATYKGLKPVERLTPPISPEIHTLPDPFVPDDVDCEIPEPLDIESDLLDEITAADTRLLHDDLAFWHDISSRPTPSPERYPNLDIPGMIKAGHLSAPSPFSSPRPLPRDSWIDVPLLPPDLDTDEPLRVLNPEDLTQARALTGDLSDPLPGPDDEFTSFLRAKAETVMRAAEQEKLSSLGALARIAVPIMDFSISAPDWEKIKEPMAMAKRIRDCHTDLDWQGPLWPNNKAEEQQMVWAPVPRMGKEIKLRRNEKIEAGPGVMEALLRRPREADMLKSGDCLNRQAGLMTIWRGVDDQSDIEECDDPGEDNEGVYEEGWQYEKDRAENSPDIPRLDHTDNRPISNQNVTPPAQGKALAYLLGNFDKSSGRKRPASQAVELTSTDKKSTIKQRQQPRTDSFTMDLLANSFNDSTRCVKKAKLMQSPYFGHSLTTLTAELEPELESQDDEVDLIPIPATPSPPFEPIPAIAPHINVPEVPPRIIISSAVSKELTENLATLVPGIQLIERKLGNHRPHSSRIAGEDEADVIISPVTGILLTTMVMLRQKPLPGSTGQPPLRSVIESVATRYERLLVIISQGSKRSETISPLSRADSNALAEFQGFAAGLETQVDLLYVGGGDATVAKWVATAICKHAPEALPVQDLLLPVETGWEMFMRRAGMNAYAAQVALGTLEVPDGEPAIGGQHLHGLPLFVSMSPEERLHVLGDVLGGRRLLDRASEVIDEPYSQGL